MLQRLALITLLVREYDEAIAFYVNTLGFTLLEDTDLGHGKRWVRVAPSGSNGPALLVARATNPAQQAAIGNQTGGRVFLFIETDNFDNDFLALIAKNVSFDGPPRAEPYGQVVVMRDLYGNRIDLIGPSAT